MPTDERLGTDDRQVVYSIRGANPVEFAAVEFGIAVADERLDN
jgi:hypothetical protein